MAQSNFTVTINPDVSGIGPAVAAELRRIADLIEADATPAEPREFKHGDKVIALPGARNREPERFTSAVAGRTYTVVGDEPDDHGDIELLDEDKRYRWCLPQYLKHV